MITEAGFTFKESLENLVKGLLVSAKLKETTAFQTTTTNAKYHFYYSPLQHFNRWRNPKFDRPVLPTFYFQFKTQNITKT